MRKNEKLALDNCSEIDSKYCKNNWRAKQLGTLHLFPFVHNQDTVPKGMTLAQDPKQVILNMLVCFWEAGPVPKRWNSRAILLDQIPGLGDSAATIRIDFH